jgi:hypothetical protein
MPDTLTRQASVEAEAVARTARLRHRAGVAISAVAGAVTTLFVYIGVVAVAQIIVAIPQWIRVQEQYDRGEIRWQEYLMVGVYQNAVFAGFFLYVGLFLLPFVVSLPIASPIVLLWQRPARLLFLRPFNRRPLTRGLSRLVRRDVARYGHVYTLADANIRVRWWVRMPALLGQVALLSFRARKIKRPRQLHRLDRAIARTWMRNINWCLSWKKVFAVASADACWQQVVEKLLHRSTVIFIDLTEARPNVLWEIDLIRRLGLERRVVWLLARSADAQTIATSWPPGGEPIHRYDDSGAADREAFGAAVAERIAEQEGESRRQPALQWLSIAALVMFGIGCFPLLVLWLPGPAQRLADISSDLPLAILAFGLATLLAFAAIAAKNRNAIFFVLVQILLIVIAVLGGMPVTPL